MQVYAETRLNCHPCLYDAYGMTIVEAASQGAEHIPVLLHLLQILLSPPDVLTD